MNIIGHAIDEDPRRILVLYPTTGQAEKWSKETLDQELFEATPGLHHMVRGGRRDASNTILHKIFPGGMLNAFGGNAPGEMRRAKGNLLFADEIDALQAVKSDEGDQLDIFWMRGSEYPDAIKIAGFPARGREDPNDYHDGHGSDQDSKPIAKLLRPVEGDHRFDCAGRGMAG